MKSLLQLLKDFYIERIILYCFIAIFSFLVIVPLGDLKIRFTDGHCSRCLLYSSVSFQVNSTTSRSYCQQITFGEQEVCEYSIAVSSVFCLIYPIFLGVAYFFMYRRDSGETREEKKLDLAQPVFLLHILAELAIVVLMLVSAGSITHGFRHLCDSVTSSGSGLGSCMDADNVQDWCGYDGSNFYVSLAISTAGSWCLFVVWLLQGMLGVWKLWRLNMLPALPSPCCRRDD